MKLLILAIALSAVSAQLPPYLARNPVAPAYYPQYQARARAGLDRSAQILRSSSDVSERGFQYAFETENGIQAQESGVEANGIQAQGGYSYVGDDGQVYSVTYTADGNGFQAQGAHLPTPPPIPEAIARSLLQNAQDEANGIFDDGTYREGKYSSGGAVVAARAQYPRPAFRQRPYY
ncbi:unnamed protein product [Plutella xylostella]|uniref:(diamondback moth) hypothetical protein n=1 Tax=Plutella xylostella TaxID=51655 RepID=A0A8S4FG17_PLUXY|nr:unnamed protein product [Plutella xylostella]